ncbi:MAG: LL-diaminopimelate aminotransferase, partial [Proteobacteria bacterium]|nr:LL-diaminopimelate aminotransferase [Pseudomonadota bacterium]
MFELKTAERLRSLPPYLFADLDRKKEEVADSGINLIDLGVGDPDMPTPDHI